VTFICACAVAGDALGDADDDGVAWVTGGELELFGAGAQAIVNVNVAMRLKSKMRGSKVIG